MANDQDKNIPDNNQTPQMPTREQFEAAQQRLKEIMEKPEEELSADEKYVRDMATSRYTVFRHVKMELKSGYVLRKVGQAYMVMPTGPRMKEYEGMITLNETGAFLYKEMGKPEPSEEKLVEASMAEYGASREEAEKAVEMFIAQCAECGLLEFEEVILDKETGKQVTREEIDEQGNQ